MSKIFAKNLRLQRKLKRVSQRELAIYLDIARSTVSAWENNISEPNIETLKHIREYLGVTYNNLLD